MNGQLWVIWPLSVRQIDDETALGTGHPERALAKMSELPLSAQPVIARQGYVGRIKVDVNVTGKGKIGSMNDSRNNQAASNALRMYSWHTQALPTR